MNDDQEDWTLRAQRPNLKYSRFFNDPLPKSEPVHDSDRYSENAERACWTCLPFCAIPWIGSVFVLATIAVAVAAMLHGRRKTAIITLICAPLIFGVVSIIAWIVGMAAVLNALKAAAPGTGF